MFKGKKSIYILLPLNLFIWTFVGYKIYSALGEENIPLPANMNAATIKLSDNDSVNHELALDYSDPFLKAEARSANHNSGYNLKKPAVSVIHNNNPIAPPPKNIEIKYLGLVQNKSKGSTTAMVSINGKSHLVKPGQKVDDITFSSITSEILNVKIGKEKLTIKK
jgi:hypothetical protein